MIKRVLILSLIMAFGCLAPVAVGAATTYYAGVLDQVQDQDADVSYSEGTLSVTGAEGSVLEIVSLTGKKVMSVKIESPAQKFELNIPKGCYIVKVGKVVRKVSIR